MSVHSLFGWSPDFPDLPPNVSVCFCTGPQQMWPTGIKAHVGSVHCVVSDAHSVGKVEELACSLSLDTISFTWWFNVNARNQGSSKTGMSFTKVYALLVFINCCCWNFLTAALEIERTTGKSSKDHNLLKDAIKMKLKLPLNYLSHTLTRYNRISNSRDSPNWQFLAQCDLMGWWFSAKGCHLKHWIYELAH